MTAQKEQAAPRVEPDLGEAKGSPSDVRTAEEPKTASPGTAPHDVGGIGEHVETVLHAAEDAASRIIEEARRHAAEVREEAEREAASRIDAAQATATRLQTEAKQEHAAALSAAAEARALADDDATRQRAEAEEEAAKMRADAEREVSTSAAARYQELLNDTALAEERLRRLVGGLREVADRLDGLLVPPAETRSSSAARDGTDADEPATAERLEQGEKKAGVGTG